MKKILAVLFALGVLWACGKDQILAPTPEDDPSTVVSTPTTTPPAPPVDATPAPNATLSYVELRVDGSGRFCALAVGGHEAYLTYTAPLDLSVIYGHYKVSAETGKCVEIPRANLVVKFPWCGVRKVQVDVNQLGYLSGRHMGHVFADVESEETCPKPTPTPTPTPSPTPTPTPTPTPSPTPTPTPTPPPVCQARNTTPSQWCLSGPIGNPRQECSRFGLVPIGKDDGLSGYTHVASMDATVALVKSANCYRVYTGVRAGDILASEGYLRAACHQISHVTYCGCAD